MNEHNYALILWLCALASVVTMMSAHSTMRRSACSRRSGRTSSAPAPAPGRSCGQGFRPVKLNVISTQLEERTLFSIQKFLAALNYGTQHAMP